MQNKKPTVIMTLISIFNVLLVLAGIAFAYFTASMSGNNAMIGVQAEENIGSIVFNGGADLETSSDIEPGWSETKTITLTVPAAKAQEMYIKLDYTNNMPELEYKFELTNIMLGNTNSGTSSSYVTNDYSDNGLSITSTGTNFITFDSSNTPQTLVLTEVNTGAYNGTITITYQLTLRLPETNVNQDQNQGKSFVGSLYGELNNEIIYYNSSNSNGTTTQPSAS